MTLRSGDSQAQAVNVPVPEVLELPCHRSSSPNSAAHPADLDFPGLSMFLQIFIDTSYCAKLWTLQPLLSGPAIGNDFDRFLQLDQTVRYNHRDIALMVDRELHLEAVSYTHLDVYKRQRHE